MIFVYDVTNNESYQDIQDWINLAKKCFSEDETPYWALVGNKADLADLRLVPQKLHDDLVEEHTIRGSFLTSAKTGDRVEETFFNIAAHLAGLPNVARPPTAITATLTNQPRHDPQYRAVNADDIVKGRKCVMM